MAYLLERDSLNGKDGGGFITRNNQHIELFNIVEMTARGRFRKSDFLVVGTRLIQKKITGIEHIGNLTLYYGSPAFLDMLLEYQNNGVVPYFDATFYNDDRTARWGKQTVVLKNCSFDEIPESMLNATADTLRATLPFTYQYVELLERFKDRPATVGKSTFDN